MRMIVLFSTLLGLMGTVRVADAQTGCPAETPGAQRVLTHFLGSKDHTDTRVEHGFPALGTSSFRLLTSTQDSAVCSRIAQFIDSRSTRADWRSYWAPAFYQVGDRYLAVIAPVSADPGPPAPGNVRVRLRWAPVLIFDANLAFVAGIGV